MKNFISKLLKYKYFLFGWIVSVISLILSMGFNIRWNFLNLISMLAY
ncbi:lauroyl/myristoyl acyltransferase [Enterococcus rotai]